MPNANRINANADTKIDVEIITVLLIPSTYVVGINP